MQLTVIPFMSLYAFDQGSAPWEWKELIIMIITLSPVTEKCHIPMDQTCIPFNFEESRYLFVASSHYLLIANSIFGLT